MADKNETAINPHDLTGEEAALIINLYQTINVKAAEPNAAAICSLIASSTPKLERIVRLSQPLASAAKPKEVAEDADVVLDLEEKADAATA